MFESSAQMKMLLIKFLRYFLSVTIFKQLKIAT